MSDGLTISEMSMLNDLTRMQAISHNLTNVNTTGFKQQTIKTESFNDVITIARNKGLGETVNQSIGTQLPVVNASVDTSGGAMKFTGNPLDVALSNDVFMVVQTAHGPAYTRQGDLHLDGRGRLVNATGLPVIGASGEIRLSSDKPVMNQQGKIYIEDEFVAEIKLVRFAKNAEIIPIGDALYQTTRQIAEQVDNEDLIRQGYLEASNVNMTSEMIRMIEVTRHFESTQQMIRGYDSMMDNAINVIGDL